MKIINPYRFGSSVDLLTDLLIWLSLDETSGTRTDSVSAETWAESGGTVSSTTGVISNCASFSGAGEILINAGSFMGLDQMSIALWVKSSVATNSPQIDWSGGRDCGFVSSKWRWRAPGVTNTSADNLLLSAWNHVAMTWDRNNECSIIVNNGTPTTIAASDSALAAGSFNIGKTTLASLVDEVGVWGTILSTEQISALYNSGNGIGYPG